MKDTIDRMIQRLAPCRRVLITTHVRPDGDAMGSTAALALGLSRKKIAAEVLLLSRAPRKYDFLYRENGVSCTDVEAGWPERFEFSRFDALLVVDTGTWSQLPGVQQRLDGYAGPKLVIDHHLTQEDWADEKLVQTNAAAAAEIVAELLMRWDVTLDKSIATALYLAIVSDTGWFQFSNTTPRTLRLAAQLMEAGVDTDRVYQLLQQNERPQRLALQGRAEQSLKLLANNRLAVMELTREDFLQTGAAMGETENLINIPLQVRSVEVSAMLVEPLEPGPIRVSLRSKGDLDVAALAEQFGGGGHARAAGLKIDAPLQEARNRVIAAVEAALPT